MPLSKLLLSLLFLLLLVEVSRAASGRQGLSGFRSKASFPHPDPGRSSPLRSAGAMPLRGRQQARESAPTSSGPSSEGSASEEDEVGEEVDGLDFNSFDFSGKHHPCACRRSMTMENLLLIASTLGFDVQSNRYLFGARRLCPDHSQICSDRSISRSSQGTSGARSATHRACLTICWRS